MKTLKMTTSASVMATLLMTAVVAHGGGNDHETFTSQSPSIIIQEIIRGNHSFSSLHESRYFQNFQDKEKPSLTLISCADSRVHTDIFGIDPNNKIFSIRNIANQIQNSEGSIDYGINHLSTPVLLVLGHSNCGAVKAAMGDYSNESEGIKVELAGLKAPLTSDIDQGSFNERWAKNVERNVDYQVEVAKKLYAAKVESEKLVVIGAVYDFNNHYKKGHGAMIITNVNGESNPDKFVKHSAMRFLTKSEIVARIGSLAPATFFKEPEITYGYHPPKNNR